MTKQATVYPNLIYLYADRACLVAWQRENLFGWSLKDLSELEAGIERRHTNTPLPFADP